jgi:hypothetical protein
MPGHTTCNCHPLLQAAWLAVSLPQSVAHNTHPHHNTVRPIAEASGFDDRTSCWCFTGFCHWCNLSSPSCGHQKRTIEEPTVRLRYAATSLVSQYRRCPLFPFSKVYSLARCLLCQALPTASGERRGYSDCTRTHETVSELSVNESNLEDAKPDMTGLICSPLCSSRTARPVTTTHSGAVLQCCQPAVTWVGRRKTAYSAGAC